VPKGVTEARQAWNVSREEEFAAVIVRVLEVQGQGEPPASRLLATMLATWRTGLPRPVDAAHLREAYFERLLRS